MTSFQSLTAAETRASLMTSDSTFVALWDSAEICLELLPHSETDFPGETLAEAVRAAAEHEDRVEIAYDSDLKAQLALLSMESRRHPRTEALAPRPLGPHVPWTENGGRGLGPLPVFRANTPSPCLERELQSAIAGHGAFDENGRLTWPVPGRHSLPSYRPQPVCSLVRAAARVSSPWLSQSDGAKSR
jgi:hypothetical protein